MRKVKARAPPSKAKLAAKERKKALKNRKTFYEREKMTLASAINVLRVGSIPFVNRAKDKTAV